MDGMSMMPLLTTDSDEDEQGSSCYLEMTRRALHRRSCCHVLYRMFPNKKDMSFSPRDRDDFNAYASSYNIANFNRMEMKAAAAGNECLTLYCRGNSALIQGDIKEGEKCVREGLQVAMSSEKPNFNILLLASPLARVHYMKDNIDALITHLDECFQMIDALGRGVPGSILGWLYYMRARAHQNDRSAAIEYFELATDAFNISETIDKDFGVAHTLCRLIICRLGCGENADTIDEIETPIPSEMRKVECHRTSIKNMAILDQCVVIRIIFLMAETDYYFRTRKFSLALERARDAHQEAVVSKCEEFLEVTKHRENVYNEKYNEMKAKSRTQTSASQPRVIIESLVFGDSNTIINNKYPDGSTIPTTSDVALELQTLLSDDNVDFDTES